MASVNQVTLLGNVTRDVAIKYTTGGVAIADIGLAINRQWFDKSTNEKKEEVCFVDCTAFGRTAEVACEYLRRGAQCLILGRLHLDSWETNDGQKRTKLKVIVESLQLLGSKGGDTRGEEPQRPSPEPASQMDDSEVPF